MNHISRKNTKGSIHFIFEMVTHETIPPVLCVKIRIRKIANNIKTNSGCIDRVKLKAEEILPGYILIETNCKDSVFSKV